MQQRKIRPLILGLGWLIFVAGCDTVETTDGGVDGGPPVDGTVSDGPATTPDQGVAPEGLVTIKNAKESVEVTFAEGDEYLVVPYSVSDVAADDISFEITIAGQAASDVSSSGFALRQPQKSLKERDPALWLYWQQRLMKERWTRRVTAEAVKMRHVPLGGFTPYVGESCTKSADCAELEVCHGGSCEASFPLVTTRGNAEWTTATEFTVKVVKKGQTVAILADDADAAGLDTGAVDALLETIETVILPRDVALFGDPPLQDGGEQTASDRNNDGLLWIVLTNKVHEKATNEGFFNAIDFTEDATSNKTDILYIDTDTMANAYATIAHELQHLLHYGAKVYKPQVAGGQGKLEDLWLDEGQAHFAEDASGFGSDMANLIKNYVIADFSDQTLFESGIDPDTGKINPSLDSLEMRGKAMTYVRYLFERAGGVTYNADGTITDKGGAAMLQKLHLSSKTGTAAVTEVAGDYKAAFDGWITAIALDGRGVTDYAPYLFAPLSTDPKTGSQMGIKIRGTMKDADGADVTLEGPLEEDLTEDTEGTVPYGMGKFFLVKGMTGKVTISVLTEDSDFRFAVIKVSQ